MPGVVQATASPNTGNLYVYASSKSAYTYYEYAEALNGVNLYVSAPTGTPATTVTVTVMVRLISASVSGSGHVEVGALVGTQNMGYMDFTGPRIAPQTLPPFMNTIPINPAPGFSGWNTGTTHQVGGYLTAYLSGSGTVIARAQVQYIELQFS